MNLQENQEFLKDLKIFSSGNASRSTGLLLWSCDAGAPDGPDNLRTAVQLSTVGKKRRSPKIMKKSHQKTQNHRNYRTFQSICRLITETQRSPAVNEVTEGFNSCWLQRKDPKDKDKTVLDLGQKVFWLSKSNRWQFFVCQQFSKVLWLWKEVTTFSGFLSFC